MLPSKRNLDLNIYAHPMVLTVVNELKHRAELLWCAVALARLEDCDTSSSPIHPLPFCPFGGATGRGCIRGQRHGKHVHKEISVV